MDRFQQPIILRAAGDELYFGSTTIEYDSPEQRASALLRRLAQDGLTNPLYLPIKPELNNGMVGGLWWDVQWSRHFGMQHIFIVPSRTKEERRPNNWYGDDKPKPGMLCLVYRGDDFHPYETDMTATDQTIAALLALRSGIAFQVGNWLCAHGHPASSHYGIAKMRDCIFREFGMVV